jgi:hypothetical protein
MIGQIFGRWTVLRFHGKTNNFEKLWWCVCECDTERAVRQSSLRKGAGIGGSLSCGCFMVERTKEANTKHGLINTPEYGAWSYMMKRCYHPKTKGYKHWGGRGITVDPEWHDFLNFLRDMGTRPSSKHSLDRKDNDGNYTKDNCKWSLPYEQVNNRTITVYLNGTSRSELAKQHNMSRVTLVARLSRGWSLEAALNTPVRPLRKFRRAILD